MNTIIIIIIFSGFVGGLTDFLRSKYKIFQWQTLFKHLLSGICASFVVPLFLNMISSDIVSKVSDDINSTLVFIGFCIIAALFSTNFLNKVSEQIIDKLQNDVDNISQNIINTDNEVEALIAQSSQINEDINSERNASSLDQLNDHSKVIIEVLGANEKAYVAENLISQSGKISDALVHKHIKKLVDDGLVMKYKRENDVLYGLSYSGRKQYNSFGNDK